MRWFNVWNESILLDTGYVTLSSQFNFYIMETNRNHFCIRKFQNWNLFKWSHGNGNWLSLSIIITNLIIHFISNVGQLIQTKNLNRAESNIHFFVIVFFFEEEEEEETTDLVHGKSYRIRVNMPLELKLKLRFIVHGKQRKRNKLIEFQFPIWNNKKGNDSGRPTYEYVSFVYSMHAVQLWSRPSMCVCCIKTKTLPWNRVRKHEFI